MADYLFEGIYVISHHSLVFLRSPTTTVFLGRREYECSIFLDNYPFMFFFLRLPVRFSILSSWNPHVLFPRILSISFLLPFKPHPRCDTQILLLYFRHHSPHYSYHAKMRPGLENSGAISWGSSALSIKKDFVQSIRVEALCGDST